MQTVDIFGTCRDGQSQRPQLVRLSCDLFGALPLFVCGTQRSYSELTSFAGLSFHVANASMSFEQIKNVF